VNNPAPKVSGELWRPVPLHVRNGMEYRQILTVERSAPP
jgi:hypothetical protein